jgi:phosphopantothenoylcysteine decarboxylase/phosphopantothenate--cysteine ligase
LRNCIKNKNHLREKMSSLTNKKILVGITGSIAAYKTCELVRELKKLGAQVRVAMTKSACEFVTPMTLQALSGERVQTDLLDAESEAAMGHIELARWADRIIVAPASANFIARLANGEANDLLTTLCLATTSPISVAPAMNQQMWQNESTQNNIQKLLTQGIAICGPDSGEQACGEVGPGRMLEPLVLLQELENCFETGALSGKTVLLTAGPTREAIDPVRYLTNRSSGKMGYALAVAARDAGARVIVVSGPVTLPEPDGIELVKVKSAQQMHEAVLQRVVTADIFIGAAAVADYRVANIAEQKIKKSAEKISLELVKNPDILASVAALNDRPFTVGFAAETENLKVNAASKLRAKQLDMIVANLVGEDLGFDQEENQLLMLTSNGVEKQLPLAAKSQLAARLISLISDCLST